MNHEQRKLLTDTLDELIEMAAYAQRCSQQCEGAEEGSEAWSWYKQAQTNLDGLKNRVLKLAAQFQRESEDHIARDCMDTIRQRYGLDRE